MESCINYLHVVQNAAQGKTWSEISLRHTQSSEPQASPGKNRNECSEIN